MGDRGVPVVEVRTGPQRPVDVRRSPLRSTVTTVPGSTSYMPSQMAWPGVLTKAKSSRRPSRPTFRPASGWARIAFGSEPNSTPSGVG